MAEESVSSISRYNGMDNISISVSKNQSANTIDVCDKVVDVVNELNGQGLGLAITVTSNSGETIYQNIMNVVQSLILGLVLAMFVLVAFLGDCAPRSSSPSRCRSPSSRRSCSCPVSA